MISHLDITRMKQEADKTLYSALGQLVRIEWQTQSGGIYKNPFEVYVGGTLTKNVLDTVALISSIRDSELKLMDSEIVRANPAIIKLRTNVNLKNHPNFRIIQKIKDEYWTGAGTGAGSVWTPDSAPNWTADQWRGFWLWFSDKRFEVLSNTATALTVNLAGDTLPASSTTGEIMSVKEWYPVFNQPTLGGGVRSAAGTHQLLQSVLCTEIPIRGDQE